MSYLDIHDDTNKKLTMRRVRAFAKQYRRQIVVTAVATYLVYQLIARAFWQTPRFAELIQDEETGTEDMQTIGQDLYKQNEIEASRSLRERMAFFFPYEREKPLPRTIWQTWKCDEDDPQFPKKFVRPHSSWKTVNPKSDVSLIPDSHVEEFVENTFHEVPEIVATFKMLPENILKADFFRYLVVYARGGTYSDLDTVCLKPIDTWAPFDGKLLKQAQSHLQKRAYVMDSRSMVTPVGLTIGIEADPDRPDWADWYARRIQFCQWTIQGKRGHPLLRELIVRIVHETARKKTMGVLRSVEGKDRGGDIMQWTGPGIFTDVVFDYLNNVVTRGKSGDGFGVGSKYWLEQEKYNVQGPEVGANHEPLNSDKQRINWKTFASMEEPVMVEDVLVLPITSFSPGVGQMGSQSVKHPLAYVQHLFGGTWKPEEERMIGKNTK